MRDTMRQYIVSFHLENCISIFKMQSHVFPSKCCCTFWHFGFQTFFVLFEFWIFETGGQWTFPSPHCESTSRRKTGKLLRMLWNMHCTVLPFALLWLPNHGATPHQVEQEKLDMVSVFFSDIVGYTTLCSSLEANKASLLLSSTSAHCFVILPCMCVCGALPSIEQ